MRSHKRDQAAVSVIVPKGGIRGNDGAQAGGLMGRESIASAVSCAIARCRAMLCLPSRLTGCRLGGLRVQRRLFATLHDSMCGVSFGVHRNHGLIASVPHYGLMPCGKPSGLLCPFVAVRQPARRLPPSWRLVGDFFKSNKGILAMMRTLSRNVSTAFPSIPEPIFLPVQSCHKRVEERPQVNTFTDVADSAEGLPCAIARCRAILSVLVRMNGRRRGNLPTSTRRTIAASRLARGVSFGGSSNHGVIASALLGALYPQFLTGSRAGGFRACRFRVRGISTPHGLPSPWKGSAVLQTVHGALAMMRTLSRNVSTAFPSIPEPIFLPVQSCHKRVEERPQVNTFTDVADSAEGLLQRAQAAYREAAFLPSAVARAELRARVSDYLAELIAFCREVESLPVGQNLKEARHG